MNTVTNKSSINTIPCTVVTNILEYCDLPDLAASAMVSKRLKDRALEAAQTCLSYESNYFFKSLISRLTESGLAPLKTIQLPKQFLSFQEVTASMFRIKSLFIKVLANEPELSNLDQIVIPSKGFGNVFSEARWYKAVKTEVSNKSLVDDCINYLLQTFKGMADIKKSWFFEVLDMAVDIAARCKHMPTSINALRKIANEFSNAGHNDRAFTVLDLAVYIVDQPPYRCVVPFIEIANEFLKIGNNNRAFEVLNMAVESAANRPQSSQKNACFMHIANRFSRAGFTKRASEVRDMREEIFL